jgi:hypothetical protein
MQHEGSLSAPAICLCGRQEIMPRRAAPSRVMVSAMFLPSLEGCGGFDLLSRTWHKRQPKEVLSLDEIQDPRAGVLDIVHDLVSCLWSVVLGV